MSQISMKASHDIDWQLIRLKFEAGDSAYKISQDLGGRPTKQGISKRAKAEQWSKGVKNGITVASKLPIVQRALSLTGPTKCTAERVGFVLELIARGSTPKLAATAAGISDKTLTRWSQEDPQLAEQIRQARAGKLAEWIGYIDRAAVTDWKAADRLLQTSQEAEGFQPHQRESGGITVVLNIDRDGAGDGPKGVTIDAKP